MPIDDIVFFCLIKLQISYNNDDVEFITESYIKGVEIIYCYKTKKLCLIYALSVTNEYKEIISSSSLSNHLNVKKGVRVFSKVKIENFDKKIFLLPYLGYSNKT